MSQPTPVPTRVEHYENFPVASVLCPPALRPPIVAIYHVARTADDLADEGDAPAAQRLADLAAFRAELRATYTSGRAPDGSRWAGLWTALAVQIRRHALPQPLLEALLDAFEHDVREPRHANRASLLAYCANSANPIGRLLLHLHGVQDEAALRQSDAVCSALQLINFWQDLRTDLPRGRRYLPLDECRAHGFDPDADPARWRDAGTQARFAALLSELTRWTRALMRDGAPLVHHLPGRVGWELRLVVQGGLCVLDQVEALGPRVLWTRPRLRPWHGPGLLWRAARM
ncbi:squalene synthase HpnC [Leptothrix discophora]|uniref:Squalene synthase HpnC n=1 Tax=Leptothrix discophora TaxID=89 RepID=A0ABT9FYD6_LEPDI|nr:squalene synthase HpnC [Leptothrix discophora]MDP4299244.1 squalene synthase HpnC [Leptothrix discophora]